MKLKDIFKPKTADKSALTRSFTPSLVGGGSYMPNMFYSGKSDYLNWYLEIPQLRGIIDYKVSSYLNGNLTFKQNDETVENNLTNVFNNPNPFMGSIEFWETVFKQIEIYQGCYIYKLTPTGFNNKIDNVKGLFVLPFDSVKPVLIDQKTNLLTVTDLNNYIAYYEVRLNGRIQKVNIEDIWFIQTSSLIIDNGGILKPNNRLDSLIYSFSNIKVANKAKNIALDKNGFLGFFSNGTGSGGDFGQIQSFDSEGEEKFQKWLDDYGFGDLDKQFALTNLNLKYNKIDFDINSLKINEGLDYELKTIADVMKFDLLLLNQVKGSTFSNKQQAEKGFYQNSIMPTAKMVASSLKNEFELTDDVYFDYSHLAILQEDLLKLSKFNETQTKTILSINTQIANKELTRDVGLSILENILNISNELAETLIINENEINTSGDQEA